MNAKKNYYTAKEAKEIVFSDSISMTTFHKLVRSKEIPSVSVFQKKLIPVAWVEEMIKKASGTNA